MQTILLYGYLGREFGRVHKYDVKSPAEAIRALCVTLKGFRQAIRKDGAYRVLVAGKDALDKGRLTDPVSQKETIRIVPVIAGAGRGWGQFILGVALIFASSGTYGWGEALGATAASAVGAVGVSLAIGGISRMLMKTPGKQSLEKADNRPSFGFDGAINTVAQGNPVPVLYGGPLMVGSQVVSAGLSVEQL